MFYSHQLLARKAPLGQIWVAATMKSKINRKNLDKLDIIQICEEILYPAVPMALRLSGILMEGVVIVYERKVKFLYDDVNRLMIDINKVWKINSVEDRTVLPRKKNKAKYEAITVRELNNVEEIENSSHLMNTTNFQAKSFFSMNLDDVDVGENLKQEGKVDHNLHQADPADITLLDNLDTEYFRNSFGSNNIFGDQEEVQVNLFSNDPTDFPDLLFPSPPRQDEAQKENSTVNDFQSPLREEMFNFRNGYAQLPEDIQREAQVRRRPKRAVVIEFDEENFLPGDMYTSWLRDTSDILSKGARKKKCTKGISSMKAPDLMELPQILLGFGLIGHGKNDIFYPNHLLDLCRDSAKTCIPAIPKKFSPPHPPSSSSRPDQEFYQDFASEGLDNEFGVRSQSLEIRRTFNDDIITQTLENISTTNHADPPLKIMDPVVAATPRNSAEILGSGPSIGRKRGYSLHSGSSLETVVEDFPYEDSDQHFKLARLSEDEPILETGATQTQTHRPVDNDPIDKITDSIRIQLKTHFETPGAPQFESLDRLTSGMNPKRAAQLLYQTCVLATRDMVRVDQKVAYGDILISRGPKM